MRHPLLRTLALGSLLAASVCAPQSGLGAGAEAARRPPLSWLPLATCTADPLVGVFCCRGSAGILPGLLTRIRLDAVYRCGDDPRPRVAGGVVEATPTSGLLLGEVCTDPITNEECPEPLTFGWLGQLTLMQAESGVVLIGYGERLF